MKIIIKNPGWSHLKSYGFIYKKLHPQVGIGIYYYNKTLPPYHLFLYEEASRTAHATITTYTTGL
jgi:hypothetical protein